MGIPEAVATLAQYVRDTGKPLAIAVRDAWSQLGPFSAEDMRTLMQEALAARANPMLNNPLRERSDERAVAVQVEHRSVQRYEVTCQLLHDAIYHVNGVAKSIAVFTRFDVSTKLESVRRVEAGVTRHRQMWEYVLGRMNACKKERVEDLAEGEQIKIARVIFDLRQQKEPLELVN